VTAKIRSATAHDAEAIATIYNEGIAERTSTFETEPRSLGDVRGWLDSERHPVLVAPDGESLAGWGRVAAYSPRAAYGGIGEASVYVAAAHRGHGIGGALAAGLLAEAERAGYHKLIGKLFTDNEASLQLVRRLGFREVGVHMRHGRLHGRWRDVLLVELLLDER